MRRLPTAATALGALLAVLVSACGGPTVEEPGGTPPPTADQPAGTSEPGPATAPPTRQPSAKPAITAAPAGWNDTVSYPDGVEVRLVSDDTRAIDETGPGAITNQQARTIKVQLTNGSDRAIDLNRVEVTLTVGDVAAEPYPSQDAQTFAGTAKPGASVTGTYSWLLPDGDTQTVTVDFDDQYAAAVFEA